MCALTGVDLAGTPGFRRRSPRRRTASATVEYKVRFNAPIGMPFTMPYTGEVNCEAGGHGRGAH